MRRYKKGSASDDDEPSGGGDGGSGASVTSLRAAQLTSFCVALCVLYALTGGATRACRSEACCAHSSGLRAGKHAWVTATFNDSGRQLAWRMAIPAPSSAPNAGAGVGVGVGEETTPFDAKHGAKVLKALRDAGERAVLLDAGAGRGWVTLLARAAGHATISIEPHAAAAAYLNASLCAWGGGSTNAPGAALAHVALGSPAADGAMCELWASSEEPPGESQLVCGTADEAAGEFSALRAAGFRAVDRCRVRALDELMRDGALPVDELGQSVVVRSDVAGWEPMLLEGARAFFDRYRPAWIAIFRPALVRRAALTTGSSARESRWRPAEFLRAMQALNYTYKMRTRSYQAQQSLVFRPLAASDQPPAAVQEQ